LSSLKQQNGHYLLEAFQETRRAVVQDQMLIADKLDLENLSHSRGIGWEKYRLQSLVSRLDDLKSDLYGCDTCWGSGGVEMLVMSTDSDSASFICPTCEGKPLLKSLVGAE